VLDDRPKICRGRFLTFGVSHSFYPLEITHQGLKKNTTHRSRLHKTLSRPLFKFYSFPLFNRCFRGPIRTHHSAFDLHLKYVMLLTSLSSVLVE
jgi:hypothetical protein